jgi:hypothetical protein
MDIVVLIKSGMGLVVVLAVLVFLLFYSSKKKKAKVLAENKPLKHKEEVPTFDALRAIIKDRNSSSQELKKALDTIIKYYGTVSGSGKSSKSNFDVYMGIVFNICRHPNTTKNIILDFDKELTRINPKYKSEINDAITKGLNSRGA